MTSYFYSPKTGLIKTDSDLVPLRKTEDEAYLAYYTNELSAQAKIKKDLEHKLNSVEKRVLKLNNDFGWLREKYPEEFI